MNRNKTPKQTDEHAHKKHEQYIRRGNKQKIAASDDGFDRFLKLELHLKVYELDRDERDQ